MVKRAILVLFVCLVGCSSGAFCETSRARCPPVVEGGPNQIAFCIAPGVDAQSCQEAVENCESGVDFAEASCSMDEPTCPEGWALHCYD